MDDYRLNSDRNKHTMIWHFNTLTLWPLVTFTVCMYAGMCAGDNTVRRRWGSINVRSSHWCANRAGISIFLKLFFSGKVEGAFSAISYSREVLIKHQLVFSRHDIFQRFLQPPCRCIGLDLRVINPGSATILNRLLWVSLRECKPGGFTVVLWLRNCYWEMEWIYKWNSPSSAGSFGSQTDAI